MWTDFLNSFTAKLSHLQWGENYSSYYASNASLHEFANISSKDIENRSVIYNKKT